MLRAGNNLVVLRPGYNCCVKTTGGVGPTGDRSLLRCPHKNFYFICNFTTLSLVTAFKSISFVPREVKASPDLLEKIYESSRLGLKGDALAYAAGLQPTEFRQLCQLDNAASIAEAKGRADAEVEAASVLRNAALDGDAKSALELLKHLHGWVAKTQVQVDVKSQISIVSALQEAESRVLIGRVYDAERVALTLQNSPVATANLANSATVEANATADL